MNKKFKVYMLAWIVVVALFNVITFVIPSRIGGYDKYDGTFWVGYIFIMLAFVGQLAVAYYATKEENLQKLFYRVPLIKLSFTGLVAMLVCGGVCIAVVFIPTWVGIICCITILAINVVSMIKAEITADIIDKKDEVVKTKTHFIKSITKRVQFIGDTVIDSEIKECLRKLYEVFRYSDPMSSDELLEIEGRITQKIYELENTIKSCNKDTIKNMCEDITVLVNERNRKCKLLK